METPLTGAERAARFRARLKDKGLRRVQMVIPDFSTPEFQAQLKAAGAQLAADLEAGTDPELESLLAFSRAAWAATPD